MQRRGERGYVLLLVPVVLLGIITLAYTSMRKSRMSLRIAGGELNYLQTELCSQQCVSLAVNATARALNTSAQIPARTEACRCGGLSCSNEFSAPVQDHSADCHGFMTARTLVDIASSCREGQQELAKISESVQFQEIPIFQFAVFFEKVLELHPGPPMHLLGAVHSNDSLRLYPETQLYLHDWITSAKTIEMRLRFNASPNAGTFFSLFAGGTGPRIQATDGAFRPLHRVVPDWTAFQRDHRVAYGDQGGKCGKVERFRLNVQHLPDPHALIDWRAASDPTDLRRWKYAWKANLIYKGGWRNNDLSAAYLDNPISPPADAVLDNGRVTFWDNRDSLKVKLIPIDIRKLQQRPGDSVIYLYDTWIDPLQGGRDAGGFLFYNGKTLRRGLTIASNSRVFMHGSFNVDSSYALPGGIRKPFPASIASDVFTQLSDEWKGTDPPIWQGPSIRARNPLARTVLNSCLMIGMIARNGSWSGQGGYHNIIRYMEDWTNIPHEFSGSTVSLWDSRLSQASFSGNRYAPPIRNWSYEQMYRDLDRLPPGTPRLVSPVLNTWEMSRR